MDMAKSAEVFSALYDGSQLIIDSTIYVVQRNSYNSYQEIVIAGSEHPHSNSHYRLATMTCSNDNFGKDRVKAYTIGERCSDRSRLRTQSTILLASTSSKNIQIGTISTSGNQANYGENGTTFWLDSDFTESKYKAYLLTEIIDSESKLLPNDYDIKNTKGSFMTNIKSPNGTRTVNGSTIASLSDHQLLPLYANLRGINQLIEDGKVTKATAISLTSLTAKDLEDGEDVYLAEIKFRGERETLAEIAKLEAEALELRSREERQAAVNAKLAVLKATVETPTGDAVVATATVPVTETKRKR